MNLEPSPASTPDAAAAAESPPTQGPAFAGEPWKKSWFYIAPGEVPTFFWLVLIHAVAVAGLIFLPLPSWPVLLTFAVMTTLGGLGTTVGYHRLLSHRGLKMNVVAEQILVFLACFNGSSHPLAWVANHRLHHAYADKPGDVSSPLLGGFWWSHLRWLYQVSPADPTRWAPDIQREARFRFWSKAQVPLLALSLFCGLLSLIWLSPMAALVLALWVGPIRLVAATHAQCSINSITHLGEIAPIRGTAINLWWLTPFVFFSGENWHSNHHTRGDDPRLGYGSQVDLGWLLIVTLEKLGLASNIKRPPRRDLFPAVSSEG